MTEEEIQALKEEVVELSNKIDTINNDRKELYKEINREISRKKYYVKKEYSHIQLYKEYEKLLRNLRRAKLEPQSS